MPIYQAGVCYKRKFVSKRGYVSEGWYVSEKIYIMKNHVKVPTSPKRTYRWVRFIFCNRPQRKSSASQTADAADKHEDPSLSWRRRRRSYRAVFLVFFSFSFPQCKQFIFVPFRGFPRFSSGLIGSSITSTGFNLFPSNVHSTCRVVCQ